VKQNLTMMSVTEAGVSKNPCQETYLGTGAFSEKETDNIRKYFNSLKQTPVLTMSIHSALNALMYGMSYKDNVEVKNKEEVVNACVDMIKMLNKVHGQNFTCMHATGLCEITQI